MYLYLSSKLVDLIPQLCYLRKSSALLAASVLRPSQSNLRKILAEIFSPPTLDATRATRLLGYDPS
jgi:hypothetical protein